ncbi:MAG TPA: hypothetical protein DCY33_04265 [Gemmatimonadetes bacterium]|nr:hypothetical protein [Gemmatimonadota bacterium]
MHGCGYWSCGPRSSRRDRSDLGRRTQVPLRRFPTIRRNLSRARS